MKTLNFLFLVTLCLMAISQVSATYYIIKTFENYSSKTNEGPEGTLTENGKKRVDCFAGLIPSKINQPQYIFYKAAGTKNGVAKVNSKEYTAKAIAEKLGVPAQEIEGTETSLATFKSTFLDKNSVTDAIFVWSDKDKAPQLAKNLGAANAPDKFPKGSYGSVWAITGDKLEELTMDCQGLPNKDDKSGASTVRYSVMTVAAAVMSALYFLL